MQAFREEFEYDFVLMLGDNVYDGATPDDYRRKFELPYKPLLDAGVKFYAVIGNHDDPQQHLYPLFNTGGQRYYTFKPEKTGAGGAGGAERAVLHAGHREPGHDAGPLAAAGAGGLGLGVEDRRLPSADVHLRPLRPARAELPPAAGARVPAARRERGLLRPRALLRAHAPAEGHRLLHLRRRGIAARGATSAARRSPPPASTRTSASCWSRSRATTSTSRPSRGRALTVDSGKIERRK